MPHPHHHPEWMENEEKDRTTKEIGDRLVKIGQVLLEKGEFKLGRSLVKPDNPSLFIIRFERMPRGELSLKLELKWPDSGHPSRFEAPEGDLPIE